MGAIDFFGVALFLFSNPGNLYKAQNGSQLRHLALSTPIFLLLSFHWFMSSSIFVNCSRQIFSKMSVAPADLLQEEGKSVVNDLPRGVNTAGSYRKVCLNPPRAPPSFWSIYLQ